MVDTDKAIRSFENSIKFIAPKAITSKDEANAYMNLKKEQPNTNTKKKKSANKNSSLSGQDSSSQNISNKIDSSQNSSENSPGTFSSDNLKEDNSEVNIINQASSSIKLPVTKEKIKTREKIKFGQHENFSFFESFAREIIFQIFEYRLMYFFGYQIKKADLESDNVKDTTNQKKDKGGRNDNNDNEGINHEIKAKKEEEEKIKSNKQKEESKREQKIEGV